ncbi:MAG: hypothetical protein IAG13_00495, partial [Deltaproteobacteria bacterium]|nr:hypothetical protein [Nannocystaceae bacterium]
VTGDEAASELAATQPRKRRSVLPWLVAVAAVAAGASYMLSPGTWPRLAELAVRGFEDVSGAVGGPAPSDVAGDEPSIARTSVAPTTLGTDPGSELGAQPVAAQADDRAPTVTTVAMPLAVPVVQRASIVPPPPTAKSKSTRSHGKRSRMRPDDSAPVVAPAVAEPVEPTPAELPVEAIPAVPETTAQADSPVHESYEANGPHGAGNIDSPTIEAPAERAAALEPTVTPEPADEP